MFFCKEICKVTNIFDCKCMILYKKVCIKGNYSFICKKERKKISAFFRLL